MKTTIWKRPGRLVLLVILVAVVGWITVEKVIIRSQLGEGPRQTYITVSAEGVRDFIADAVIVNDPVFKKGESQLYGRIVDVEVRPARTPGFNTETGITQIVEIPDHYDVFITIEATTMRSPFGNTLINNGIVELNQYLPIYTSHASLKTRVISIEDVKGANK